ncbi:MAG: sugar ABC transporter substrate-binding protein [Ardenticatenaceae bacterium]|nr:sugar ABC transporter substrate-binding protein [Ardenticatenaceae bacterium]
MLLKKVLGLVVVTLFSIAAVACGSPAVETEPETESAQAEAPTEPPPTEAPPTEAPEPEEEKTVIEWWDYYGMTELNEELESAIALFEAEHPNIDIERTVVGFVDLVPAILEGVETGELPDIMIVDNPNHQALAAVGAMADLTDIIADWDDKDQYFDGPWSSTVFQGRNYGVPFESNATAMYYNADMLAEVGLDKAPETWEELRDVAEQLTTEERSGFCFSTSGTEEGTFTFLPFLWQAGSDIPTIGDEGSVEALSLINNLVNVDQSSPGDPMGQGTVYEQFITGQCAMMINGPWQMPNFDRDGVSFEWGVAPWPTGVESASILGGENFAIGANTDVEEAWTVIDWMTDPVNLRSSLLAVGLPNRQDMADDPGWSDPNIKVFVDQVAVARPRAYGPNYPEISEVVWTMYRNVIEGTQTPEEAAAAAGELVTPLLP